MPGALMLAPVYVYLKNNQKFIAIKGPLDFFLPDELKQYDLEYFYVPQSVRDILPIRAEGRAVSRMIELLAKTSRHPDCGITTFEVEEAVFCAMRLFFDHAQSCSLFEISIFVQEICAYTNTARLERLRSCNRLDHAVFEASSTVFLAMFLGCLDGAFLRELFAAKMERRALHPFAKEIVIRIQDDRLLFPTQGRIGAMLHERLEAA